MDTVKGAVVEAVGGSVLWGCVGVILQPVSTEGFHPFLLQGGSSVKGFFLSS